MGCFTSSRDPMSPVTHSGMYQRPVIPAQWELLHLLDVCGRCITFFPEYGSAHCAALAPQVKELAQWLESSRQGAQPRLVYEAARVSRLEQAGMGHRYAPGLSLSTGHRLTSRIPGNRPEFDLGPHHQAFRQSCSSGSHKQGSSRDYTYDVIAEGGYISRFANFGPDLRLLA